MYLSVAEERGGREHAGHGSCAGPTLGFVVRVTQTSSERHFDGAPVVVAEAESVENHRALRLAAMAGVGLEYHTSDRVLTAVHLTYDIGLSDVSESFDWRVNALLVAVELRIAL